MITATGGVDYGIHQIVAVASHGDAITNVALEFRDVLRRVGPSDVFARSMTPDVAGEVRSLEEFRAASPRGLIVYHASIGEPTVSAFLLSRPEPLVLVYHNITPARYYRGTDDAFAELLNLGRTELVEMRDRVQLAIAASEFNAAELDAIGYRNVIVIPPIVDPFRLARVPTEDAQRRHRLDVTAGRPIVLFVGQLLPHKRPDLLVKAFHVLTTYLGVNAYLVLAGHTRNARYARAITTEIQELNLGNVLVAGDLDDAELADAFRRARAFVTLSEHEGFCVPLLEAMALEVPIVARACAAIPETLGDGGLLIPAGSGAVFAAEAIAEVVYNEQVNADLIARGRERLQEFMRADGPSALLEAIAQVA